MIHREKQRAASGITLAEMLVSIGILNLILLLGAMAFADIMSLRGAHNRYYEKVSTVEYLFHSVESDVKGAQKIMAASGDYRADSKTLILRGKDGEVIYLVEDGSVRRIVQSADQPRDEVILSAPTLYIEFDLETPLPDEARSVATTVEWDEDPEIGVSHPVFSQRFALREKK